MSIFKALEMLRKRNILFKSPLLNPYNKSKMVSASSNTLIGWKELVDDFLKEV